MNMLIYHLALVLSAITFQGGNINLTVTNLRSNKGHVLVSIFNNENGFPEKASLAIRTERLAITDKQATTSFTAMPTGTYAVAILHDENDDMKMNTNFLGIPKEGYGFSNNVMGTFGPPSFSKASFEHTEKLASAISIRAKY